MNYSTEVFEHLINAVLDRKESYGWLLENNYKELAAFVSSLNGNKGAARWLEQNDTVIHQLFLAIEQDQSALQQLLHSHKELAAVAGAANGHGDSLKWLEMKNHKQLAELSLAVNNNY